MDVGVCVPGAKIRVPMEGGGGLNDAGDLIRGCYTGAFMGSL